MSETPKWTPGEWRIEEGSRGAFAIAVGGEPGEPTYAVICTRGEWGHRIVESRANACLMAAAGGLYEALASAPDRHSVDIYTGGCAEDCWGCRRRAALARARGETAP